MLLLCFFLHQYEEQVRKFQNILYLEPGLSNFMGLVDIDHFLVKSRFISVQSHKTTKHDDQQLHRNLLTHFQITFRPGTHPSFTRKTKTKQKQDRSSCSRSRKYSDRSSSKPLFSKLLLYKKYTSKKIHSWELQPVQLYRNRKIKWIKLRTTIRAKERENQVERERGGRDHSSSLSLPDSLSWRSFPAETRRESPYYPQCFVRPSRGPWGRRVGTYGGCSSAGCCPAACRLLRWRRAGGWGRRGWAGAEAAARPRCCCCRRWPRRWPSRTSCCCRCCSSARSPPPRHAALPAATTPSAPGPGHQAAPRRCSPLLMSSSWGSGDGLSFGDGEVLAPAPGLMGARKSELGWLERTDCCSMRAWILLLPSALKHTTRVFRESKMWRRIWISRCNVGCGRPTWFS